MKTIATGWGGPRDDLDGAFHPFRLSVPDAPDRDCASLRPEEVDLRSRVATLVESVKGDRVRSNQLFHYLWTMMCVRRGLMRVVREVDTSDSKQLVLEEVRTGQHRLVARPRELDGEIEGLAVQALTQILSDR